MGGCLDELIRLADDASSWVILRAIMAGFPVGIIVPFLGLLIAAGVAVWLFNSYQERTRNERLAQLGREAEAWAALRQASRDA